MFHSTAVDDDGGGGGGFGLPPLEGGSFAPPTDPRLSGVEVVITKNVPIKAPLTEIQVGVDQLMQLGEVVAGPLLAYPQLQAGMVITHINGQAVQTLSTADSRAALSDRPLNLIFGEDPTQPSKQEEKQETWTAYLGSISAASRMKSIARQQTVGRVQANIQAREFGVPPDPPPGGEPSMARPRGGGEDGEEMHQGLTDQALLGRINLAVGPHIIAPDASGAQGMACTVQLTPCSDVGDKP